MPVNNTQATSYNVTGKYRDLLNKLYYLDPRATPFLTSIAGKSNAKGTLHEWVTDVIRPGAANAQVEGRDYTSFTSQTATEKSNKTQILDQPVMVSKTSEALDTVEKNSGIAHQLTMAYKGLMKDIEFALLGNTVDTAGSSSTARTMRGLSAWMTTNVDLGDGGAVATASAAATAGTARPVTREMLEAMMVNVYEAGGNPGILMASPTIISAVSAVLWPDGSTSYALVENATLRTKVATWVSQFGTVQLIPNIVQASVPYAQNCIFILDKEYWAVSYLRAFDKRRLADNGDNIKGVVVAECTLEARQEASSGMIADIDPSA